jgi:hypothetical protein
MNNGHICALGVAALGVVASPVVYAQEAPAPVNTGRVSWTLGADVVTQYWYRGIAQENQGLILQPYVDVTFGLLSEGQFTLDAYLGTWNSLHYGNPTGDGWYESDFVAGAVLGLPEFGVSLDLSYVYLYSPLAGEKFAEEINFVIGYDDTDVMDSFGVPFTLNPYALFAFEIGGGSDAGDRRGSYFELGAQPEFANVIDSADYPVSIAIPLTLGLNMGRYYEDGQGNDNTFGFLDIGVVASVPLTFIPTDFGAWTASAGLHWIYLGDSASNIAGPQGFNVTDGSDNFFYARFGVHMTY